MMSPAEVDVPTMSPTWKELSTMDSSSEVLSHIGQEVQKELISAKPAARPRARTTTEPRGGKKGPIIPYRKSPSAQQSGPTPLILSLETIEGNMYNSLEDTLNETPASYRLLKLVKAPSVVIGLPSTPYILTPSAPSRISADLQITPDSPKAHLSPLNPYSPTFPSIIREILEQDQEANDLKSLDQIAKLFIGKDYWKGKISTCFEFVIMVLRVYGSLNTIKTAINMCKASDSTLEEIAETVNDILETDGIHKTKDEAKDTVEEVDDTYRAAIHELNEMWECIKDDVPKAHRASVHIPYHFFKIAEKLKKREFRCKYWEYVSLEEVQAGDILGYDGIYEHDFNLRQKDNPLAPVPDTHVAIVQNKRGNIVDAADCSARVKGRFYCVEKVSGPTEPYCMAYSEASYEEEGIGIDGSMLYTLQFAEQKTSKKGLKMYGLRLKGSGDYPK